GGIRDRRSDSEVGGGAGAGGGSAGRSIAAHHPVSIPGNRVPAGCQASEALPGGGAEQRADGGGRSLGARRRTPRSVLRPVGGKCAVRGRSACGAPQESGR